MATEKYTIYVGDKPVPGYQGVDLKRALSYVYKESDAGLETYISVTITNESGSTTTQSNGVRIGSDPTVVSLDLAQPIVDEKLSLTPSITGLPVPSVLYTLLIDGDPVGEFTSVSLETLKTYTYLAENVGQAVKVSAVATNDIGSATGLSPESTIEDPSALVIYVDTTLSDIDEDFGDLSESKISEILYERYFGIDVEGQCDIYWGDGEYDLGVTGKVTHQYNLNGQYEVRIRNWSPSPRGGISFEFPVIYIPFSPFFGVYIQVAKKVKEIRQWGTTQWTSMRYAFEGCYNMVGSFTDSPDLSMCSSTQGMFAGCDLFNSPIGSWNVSNITNMSGMFSSRGGKRSLSTIETEIAEEEYYGLFNQPLDKWNVSNVTNMSGMFSGTSFNQDISGWDVSSVTNMSDMFSGSKFNKNISKWNVSNVEDMSYMFAGSDFNKPLGWNVGSVRNMSGIFAYSNFNQDISWWNISSVTDMSEMFYGNTSFSFDITRWDISNVESIAYMFAYSNFDQDISKWNTQSVTNMSGMIAGHETSFTADITGWDVSNVTNMSDMFYDTDFNQDISGWDVGSVQYMSYMFDSSNFNQDISGWDVSNVIDMSYMFAESNFNQDISGWDVGSVQYMYGVFANNSDFNYDISNWDVSSVYSFIGMFENATSFNQNLGNWKLRNYGSGWPEMSQMLNNCGMSEENYSKTLIGWANAEFVPSGVYLGAAGRAYSDTDYGGSPYNNGIDARTFLVSTKGWNITGDSEYEPPMP